MVMIFLLFTQFVAFADSNPSASGFELGVQYLNENKYQEAADTFMAAAKNDKNNAALFYNWGIASYRLNMKGHAIGLWRRALFVSPEYSSAASALQFINTELAVSTDYDLNLSSKFRIYILDRLEENKVLTVTWLLLVLAGYLLIRYWAEYKNAIRDVKELPKFPVVGVIMLVAFIFSFTLTAAKIATLGEIRATVTRDALALRTGPSENDNSIFELSLGADILVNQTQNNWALVTISSGLSGWLPVEGIFQHTGKIDLW